MFSPSYSSIVSPDPIKRWTIKTTADVRQWLRSLRQADPETYRSVNVAIDMLADIGPGLGRPLVDTLQGSSISNMKELRQIRAGRGNPGAFRVRPLVAGGIAGGRQQGRRLVGVVQDSDSGGGARL
jgi:hypothetical protein